MGGDSGFRDYNYNRVHILMQKQCNFNLGGDSKSISTIDPAGIALAAIKELYKQNQKLQAANEELMERVERLEGR